MFRYLERHFIISSSGTSGFRCIVGLCLLAGLAGGYLEAASLVIFVSHFAPSDLFIMGIAIGIMVVLASFVPIRPNPSKGIGWILLLILPIIFLLNFTKALPYLAAGLMVLGIFWLALVPAFVNTIRSRMAGGSGLRLVWFFESSVLIGGTGGAFIFFIMAGIQPGARYLLLPGLLIAGALAAGLIFFFRRCPERFGDERYVRFNTPDFAENLSARKWLLVSLLLLVPLLLSLVYFIAGFARSGFETLKGTGEFIAAMLMVRYLFTGFMKHYMFHKLLSYHFSVYFMILTPLWHLLVFMLVLVLSLSLQQAISAQKYSSTFMVLSVSYLVTGALLSALDAPAVRIVNLLLGGGDKGKQEWWWPIFGLSLVGGSMVLWLIIRWNNHAIIFSALSVLALLALVACRRLLRKVRVLSLKTLQFFTAGEKHFRSTPPLVRLYQNLTGNPEAREKHRVLLGYISFTDPEWFRGELVRLAAKGDSFTISYVIAMVERYHLIELVPAILKSIRTNPNKVNFSPLESLYQRYSALGSLSSASDLGVLAQSQDAAQRLTAVILCLLDKQTDTPSFYGFLQDSDLEVQRTALRGVRLSDNSYFINQLYRLVARQELVPLVYEAFRGEELALFNASNPELAREEYPVRFVRAIKLFPDRPGERHLEIVTEAVSSSFPIVRKVALDYIATAQLQIKGSIQSFLLNNLVKHAQSMAWTMGMIREMGRLSDFDKLWPAVQWELEELHRELWQYMALLHGRPLIENLRRMLNSNDYDRTSLAVEYLDEILDESVRQVLVTLLMPSSFDEKLRNLQYYFLLERYTPEGAITAVLARERGLITDYLRAKMIQYAATLKGAEPQEQIISQLYSPSAMVAQTAVYVLVNSYPAVWKELQTRLPTSILLLNQTKNTDERRLLVSKTELLRNIPGLHNVCLPVLENMAAKLNLIDDTEAILLPDDEGFPVIVSERDCSLASANREWAITGPALVDPAFLTGLETMGTESSLALKMSGSVYTIDKESFKLLIFDYPELAATLAPRLED